MDDVPLKEYVERIFSEHKAAQDLAQQTVQTTADALKDKLAEMNQFRLQLERERALYVQAKDLTPLSERVRAIEDHKANLDGRFWALGVGLTILTTLMNLALRFWTP